MGFREKLAWASLIAHVLVFGAYFLAFVPHWSARAASSDHGLGQMAGAIIALIVLSIAAAIAITLSAPRDEWKAPPDERERLIRLRAANITAAVVTIGVIAVMNVLLLGWNPVLAANLLLAVLVIGEIVKAAIHIAYFRMAA